MASGTRRLASVAEAIHPSPASFFSPVLDSERHGGEIAADVLKSHGVEHIFTLVGGHISPILVASKQRGIRIIDVRHEVTAMFAADAVARLTGRPGVCCVTAGPGVTNTVTAVKNASMAQSPVVIIGGGAATALKGQGALQDIDQIAVMTPLVKYAVVCTSVRDIVPILKKAFQVAMSGVPGPVFVELPLDSLYPCLEMKVGLGFYDRVRRKDLRTEDMHRVVLPVEAKSEGVEHSVALQNYLDCKLPEQTVFLRLPGDMETDWFGFRNKGGLLQSIYGRYYLQQKFGGALEKNVDLRPLPISFPIASSSDVLAVAHLISTARRPVLVCGSQALLCRVLDGQRAVDPDDLQRAVESLAIPVFLGGMARGLLGRNNSLHVRQNRSMALGLADLVILVGTPADFRLDYGRTLTRTGNIVAVNADATDLSLNTFKFWTPHMSLLADPGNFLMQLSDSLKQLLRAGGGGEASSQLEQQQKWCLYLKRLEARKEESTRISGSEPAYGHHDAEAQVLVNPIDLCSKLDSVLPAKSIIVADGGDFVATSSYILRPRAPLCWLDSGAFGTLGVGGGFALGAKLVRPDFQVWLVWGDGSCAYSVAEFDTFKRHGIPVIAIVGNDACWKQIEREQVPMLGDDVGCPLEYSAYHDVAAGYGGVGLVISSQDDDVVATLKEAQDHESNGRSVLINVHIGSTTFREGSLSA